MSLKLITIIASLFLFGVLEWRWPFFRRTAGQWASLATNLELAILNIIVVRYTTALLFQLVWPTVQPFSLFHGTEGWVHFAIAFLLLDFYMYLWHRLMHSTNWGWRLHGVHHSDRHLKLTTAYRFHTLEVVLSQLPKIALISLLGMAPSSLLLYESLYAAELLFHHSNWALPQSWDRWLSWILVTPNYHRGHHSTARYEQQANYASFLSLWDRLFGSLHYPKQPEQIEIGLAQSQRTQTLWALLTWPLTLSRSNHQSPLQ